MDSSVQLMMSLVFVQSDLFICVHHLHYSLPGPICNAALKRPLSRRKQKQRQERKKNPWEQIRVELSARQISFWGLVYRHAQQIYEVVIVMHYLVKAVKGRITNGRQCPIITASPEEHRRVKLAQRHYQRFAHRKRGERKTCGLQGCPWIRTFRVDSEFALLSYSLLCHDTRNVFVNVT